MKALTGKKMIEIATKISKEAHAGQTYGDGLDYFEHHVRKVADRVKDAGYNERYETVALLHDVVEDTEVTLQDLTKHFPPDIVMAVGAMTHEKGESYMKYLMEAGTNKYARVVKYFDMKENSSNNPNKALMIKYTMGMDYLLLTYPDII